MAGTSREEANYFLVCEHGINENMSKVACSQVLHNCFSQTIGACATLGNQIRKEHDTACLVSLSACRKGNAL
jgi:hypothetical protein